MASESNDLFSSNLLLRKFYYMHLINIFSMKHDVCMCNISMERKSSRLHGGIKNDMFD